jgi:hypothetical protein
LAIRSFADDPLTSRVHSMSVASPSGNNLKLVES